MWFTCAVSWFNPRLPTTRLCWATTLCAVILALFTSRMSLFVVHVTRVLVVPLQRDAHHHRLLVIELRVPLEGHHPEAPRYRPETRVLQEHQVLRNQPGPGGGREGLELVVLGVRHGQGRFLPHLFDRGEEEDLVSYHRTADRSAGEETAARDAREPAKRTGGAHDWWYRRYDRLFER